jgi:hypothetical protein
MVLLNWAAKLMYALIIVAIFAILVAASFYTRGFRMSCCKQTTAKASPSPSLGSPRTAAAKPASASQPTTSIHHVHFNNPSPKSARTLSEQHCVSWDDLRKLDGSSSEGDSQSSSPQQGTGNMKRTGLSSSKVWSSSGSLRSMGSASSTNALTAVPETKEGTASEPASLAGPQVPDSQVVPQPTSPGPPQSTSPGPPQITSRGPPQFNSSQAVKPLFLDAADIGKPKEEPQEEP